MATDCRTLPGVMRSRCAWVARVAALCCGAAIAQPSAASAQQTSPLVATFDASQSASLACPSDGTLRGGVAIPSSGAGFVHNPRRPNTGARYGTAEMVHALVRAAAVVEREMPGGKLYINDLSLRHGGPIAHHNSHQNGRDVDVLFYLLDEHGRPVASKGVPLDPRGHGWDFGDLKDPSDDVFMKLDVPRTWRFMQALVQEPDSHVQRIFVAEHIRTLLLQHAAQIHAPDDAVRRLADATCQPETPHDDHFHVRFFCSVDDIAEGCQDTYPLYPWWVQSLADKGTAPVEAVIKPRKRRKRKPLPPDTTMLQTMHPKVVEFLKARDTWFRRPHPGRPYCR